MSLLTQKFIALNEKRLIRDLLSTIDRVHPEILNYFESRLTNARTEGFNTVCKQHQKRTYSYRSFYNYRLRVLYAC